jgi:type I restriction enzyme, S subunit
MDDWPQAAIGEVAEVFDGPHATPKTVDAGPIFLGIGALQNGRINLGETRHVTSEDFRKWTRRVKPQAGDIVFSYETRLGEAAMIPAGLECCLGRRMGLVRANRSRLDPRFFLYVYLSPRFQEFIRSRTIPGATVDRIALKEFPSFLIPVPALHEQRAVASILGALDDKIDLNWRMNETLEAMARAIFKDWFVDFGPTRAKMEGLAPYLAPEIWALFPDRLNDEGTPEGWKIGTLDQLIEVGPSEPVRKGEWTPYLEMSALPTQGPISDLPIPREYSSGTRFRNGDTLLARITPCLENGKTAFVQNLPANAVGWGSTEFIVMRSISPVPRAVSYLLAREPAFRRHAIQSMTGTSGRQRASADSISAFPVTIPSDAHVWAALGSILTPTFAKIAANADETQTLAATRDLLLPKLMSGEIDLNDVEQIVQAVA